MALILPRLIHQSWKTTDVPSRYIPGVTQLRRCHPRWKYKLWTDDDMRQMVRESFPWFLETYDSFPYPVMRADAWRPCVLYLYGGLYVDLDFYPKRCLEPLILEHVHRFPQAQIWIPHTGTNRFLFALPRCSVWLAYLREIHKRHQAFSVAKFNKFSHVLCTTGPIVLQHIAKRYPLHMAPFDPNTVVVALGRHETDWIVEQELPSTWTGVNLRALHRHLFPLVMVAVLVLLLILGFVWLAVGKNINKKEQNNIIK